MARSRQALAQQRQALVLRSQLLRDQLGTDLNALAPAFTLADRAQDAWIWVRSRPPAVLLPVLTVSVVWVIRKPTRLFRLTWGAWSAWRLWQRAARRWL
jgi:hypothetical protein